MIDYAACLLLAALLGAGGWGSWRAVRGRPRSRAGAAIRGAAVLFAAVALAGYGAFRFSKARTVQLFGGIVPRVETTEPLVALTFDDGPLPGPTERILSVLEDEGVRATFFLIGEAVAGHPGEAARIARAGHEIGNHSYTHPQMLGLSLERIRDEVERTDEQIRGLGVQGTIHFRSPYGKKLVALPLYLARTERKNIFFDVEPDSDPEVARDSARIVADVLARARPGSIVLLHVMSRHYAPSLAATPEIIRQLKQRGFRFVTVSELLQQGGATGGAAAPSGAT